MNKQQTNKKKTSKVMPDVTECIRLYKEENYPLREIAKHFKVSVLGIYNGINTAGFSKFKAKSSRCSHK